MPNVVQFGHGDQVVEIQNGGRVTVIVQGLRGLPGFSALTLGMAAVGFPAGGGFTFVAPDLTGQGSNGDNVVGALAFSAAPAAGDWVVGAAIGSDGKGTPKWIAPGSGGGGSLTVREIDGSPSFVATTLELPNGTLTNQGGGVGRLTLTATTVGLGPTAEVTFGAIVINGPISGGDLVLGGSANMPGGLLADGAIQTGTGFVGDGSLLTGLTASQVGGLGTAATHPAADFAAASHTHVYSTLTGLPTLGTAASHADTDYLHAASNLGDLASAFTARTNLGLGTLATQSGTFSGTHSGTSSGTNTGDVANTALTTGTLAQFAATTSAQLAGVVSDETGTGALVFATSPTLVTPALGTPSAVVLTNATGTAAGLTAGAVTTNANLTGPITSVGNATAVAAQTGTGSTFVMSVSPTLTTPAIGAATATTVNGVTISSGTGTLTLSTFTLTVSGTASISGTHTGTSSGNNTGDQSSVTGNAGTATALATGRAINGVTFDGTAAITVAAAASTLTGTTLAAAVVSSSLTSVGTLTGGATGAGFTLALGTSTVTGTLPAANLPALTGAVMSSAGSATTTQVEACSINYAGTVANGTYYLSAKAAYAGTINEMRGAKLGTLTCTVAIKINGTSVTGLSAVAVTTTTQDVTATAANTFAAGDEISMVISGASGATDLRFTLKVTR